MVVTALLAALATWRLTSLLAEEEGPLVRGHGILTTFRFKVSGRLLGMKGASCIWCISVWVAALITLLVWAAGPIEQAVIIPVALIPIWWLGLSGAAIVIHSLLQRLVR